MLSSERVAWLNTHYPDHHPSLRDEACLARGESLTEEEELGLDALLRKVQEARDPAPERNALAAALNEALVLLGYYWPVSDG